MDMDNLHILNYVASPKCCKSCDGAKKFYCILPVCWSKKLISKHAQ